MVDEDKSDIPTKENKISILEEPINQIIELVEKLPDRYKDKTYEKLLEKIISGEKIEFTKETKTETKSKYEQNLEFQMPIEVKAFLRQFSISDDKIKELFLITGSNEIAPIYKLKTTKAAKAQIQLSVLIALENTLIGKGKFEFSIEQIRSRCVEHKCYDLKNFMPIFKRNEKLFKNLTDSEHVSLSPLGKDHLAEVMNEL